MRSTTLEIGGLRQGSKVMVVECDCDEAIGMALTCGLGIGVERSVWEGARTTVVPKTEGTQGSESAHIMDVLPYLEITDRSVVMKTLRGGTPSTSNPIQIPRTTSSTQFQPLGDTSDNDDTDRKFFDTDNPIQSLSAYDALTNADKAQILLSLQSFRGQLPRSRTLRRDAATKSRRNDTKRRTTTDFSSLVRRPSGGGRWTWRRP